MAQIHKRFTDEAVKDLIKKYLAGEVEIKYILEILGIKRARFFKILRKYKNNTDGFSIQYIREKETRGIDKEVEENIIKELSTEKKLIIENKDVPTKFYNYSYIKDLLFKKYEQKVSLPTIIDRARKNDFYIARSDVKKLHDHEVLTNYIGELIQHDSSFHKWSPYADNKWYLITSIDDYSRLLLFAELLERETAWSHIIAAQSVFLRFGMPMKYYNDSHSIFRFVQGRDSNWREHHKVTDEVVTQWRRVLNDCNVEVIYALSPQAKGKAERPYGWLQDRIVRTCVRENIKTIEPAREVLKYEVNRYNNHQIHSTTKEVPVIRFENALKNGKSLFREFTIRPPYESVKDIFCIRMERNVNSYRRISINNLELKVNGVPTYEKVELRITPNEKTGMSEIRIWYKNRLVGVNKVKNSDLKLVYF